MTIDAKQAILTAIIKTSETDLGSNAEAFARAFNLLVDADVQQQMADLATAPCECRECKDGGFNDDFPQEIG